MRLVIDFLLPESSSEDSSSNSEIALTVSSVKVEGFNSERITLIKGYFPLLKRNAAKEKNERTCDLSLDIVYPISQLRGVLVLGKCEYIITLRRFSIYCR